MSREARAHCSEERLVDFGVELYTVEQDPTGVPIRPDGPKVVCIREPELFGGVFDTRLGVWHSESRNPVVWLASADQRRILVDRAAKLVPVDAESPLQILIEGAEGAGKTAVLARWLILAAIEFMGRGLEFGCTAPTQARLERVRQTLTEAMPDEWYSYRQRDWLYSFGNGSHRLRLVSAHRQSEAEGSPVQGYDWAGGAMDETQDQLDVVEDVRARGRRAMGGRYPLLLTATNKASPQYRTFKDKWVRTPHCLVQSLSGFANAYVDREFWEARKRELSPREYARRVLALDLGIERATYPSWDHSLNLRPIPELGVEDVTAEVLSPWGPRLTLLVGHDPGKLFDVSIMLKAYRMVGKQRIRWWVVDELTTEESTTEAHVLQLLARVRERWRCNTLDWRGRPSETGGRVLVRADPYSDSGNDEQRPDKSVYTIFKNGDGKPGGGFFILPAATIASVTKVKVGRVPKEGGIEMVNSLMCNAEKERRLFVNIDDRGEPVAPRLVAAIETSERDSDGKAEMQRKNKKDPSHWPASLRYGLWAIERPRHLPPWEEEEAAQ